MVTQHRNAGWAFTWMPAITDSTDRRWSSNGARDAQLFSFMRLPSSNKHAPPVTIAVTSGDAWYVMVFPSAITGVINKSSGLVSAVH